MHRWKSEINPKEKSDRLANRRINRQRDEYIDKSETKADRQTNR